MLRFKPRTASWRVWSRSPRLLRLSQPSLVSEEKFRRLTRLRHAGSPLVHRRACTLRTSDLAPCDGQTLQLHGRVSQLHVQTLCWSSHAAPNNMTASSG